MSQVSIVDVVGNNPQIPTRFNANVGFAIPIANVLEIHAETVAAGTNPARTIGSGNTITTQVQISQAIASTNALNVGLAAFNSSQFSVDANGFVSITGTFGQTITGNSGGARPPSSGNWNIVTANASPTFVGSGSTLTLDFGLTNLLLGSVGSSITTASANTGIGPTNLTGLTTGTGNVAVGWHALNVVSSGQSNVGVGLDALGAVTVQNNNTAVGRSALSMTTSNGATALGYAALRFNVTGDNNTAIGFQAFSNSTGSHNTGIGYNVGVNVIGGEQNVAIGALSFSTAVSSNYCTAVGYQALNACTGSQNTAIGRAALVQLGNASDSTAIGFNSLFGLTTGSQNTAIGSSSLTQILTGSNNIAIGYLAGNALTLADSGNICIGHSGVVGINNAIRIGTSGSQTTAFIAGITGVTVAASAPVGVDTNGQLSSLGFGTALQVFTSNGAGSSPTWQAPVTNNTARSAIASGSAVSLTTATNANVTSISLAAGTWLVTGICQFGGSPTVTGAQQASISVTSATHGTLGDNSVQAVWLTNSFTVGNCPITVPSYLLTLGSTTTVYLVASGIFSGGTLTAYGRISAVRIA